MRQNRVIVIGAGLAGSEAAYQMAQRGISVELYEMRPKKRTEAHKTDKCAELVCSNSFGSTKSTTASQILKGELVELGSFILSCAEKAKVPAGSSLAVDREQFASLVTERLKKNPNIHMHQEEVTEIPKDEVVIIATGPLTSEQLSVSLSALTGKKSLYFYDAISPVVSADSLNLDKMFFANRYEEDARDFLNIALTEMQYHAFVDDLLGGEVMLPHDFEKEKYFI